MPESDDENPAGALETKGAEPIDLASLDLAFMRGQSLAYDRIPKHIQFAKLALVYGLIGACIGLYKLGLLLVRTLHIANNILIPTLVTALLLTLFVVVSRMIKRSARQGQAVGKAPAFAGDDTTRRVRVLATPSRAIELLRGVPDARSGFEPEIVRVPLAIGLDRAAVKLAWVGGVLGMAGAILFEFSSGAPLSNQSLTIWFAMGMACLGAVALPEFVYPTYVRVLPGRLDVLRAPILGAQITLVKSYDLRHHPVVLAGSVIFIEPERTPGTPPPKRVHSERWPYAMHYPMEYQPEAVSLALTPARRRLEEAAFRAAITEAPTPDIPEGELIG